MEDLVTSGLKESHGLTLGAGLSAQILNVEGEAATLDLAGRFRDPEGGALTLTAASSDEAVATASLADSVLTIAPVAPGRVTVSVTARDEGGRQTTLPVAVTVYPANRPPVALTLADRKIRIGSPARVELSDAFTDPDVQDVLTYTAASSNEAVATAAVEGTGLRITPRKTGQTRVSVTARDPKGLEASLSFKVTVEPKPPPKTPPPPEPEPEPEPTASTGGGCENRLSIESSYLERRDPETNRYNRYVRVSFTVKILEAPDYSGRIWVTDCSGQALPTHVVPADISSSGQQETYEQDRAIQGGYNVQTFYVDFAPVAFKGHIDLRPADGRVCRARASLVHCQ